MINGRLVHFSLPISALISIALIVSGGPIFAAAFDAKLLYKRDLLPDLVRPPAATVVMACHFPGALRSVCLTLQPSDYGASSFTHWH